MHDLPEVVARFLAAVNDRDAAALATCLAPDMAYHLIVPHDPVVGRDAVVATMGRVLGEADRVLWETASSAVNGDLAFLERIDRFWYGEKEAAIECLGVFRLENGLITEIRDYADLETWKARKDAAMRPD